MPTLIIAGTEPGVGKTSLAAGLLVQLAGEGRSSAYYKPFSATADDADVRLEPFGPLAVILGPAPVTALPDASNMGDVSAAVRALREKADTNHRRAGGRPGPCGLRSGPGCPRADGSQVPGGYVWRFLRDRRCLG